jgi:Putative restriction endonuclease
MPPQETPRSVRPHRYRRAPEPVYFPVSERRPVTKDHLERRAALYGSVKRALAAELTIGADQFVYYDPTTPKKCLAPDFFVRLGAPDDTFEIWKTWERGTPELGVEIVSASDGREAVREEKLARYRAAGFREVVAFDAKDPEAPIRVWDMVSGDLVERSGDDPDLRRCEALGLWWVVVKDPMHGPMLRLARDREGRELLLTYKEAEAEAHAAEARAREEAREAATRAHEGKERLEAEVAALRSQLAGTRVKPRKRRP